MREAEVPVLIVGGAGSSSLPKAHVLNQHSMEILRDLDNPGHAAIDRGNAAVLFGEDS
jgi:hypothetical protein